MDTEVMEVDGPANAAKQSNLPWFVGFHDCFIACF
jgi:hypothetical protein